MRWLIIAGVIAIAASGCDVVIPNGLFGCGQASDCPQGYHCWSSDSRCYDAVEPGCTPKSCDQVIGEFASLGIPIECGSLPDGCDGSIECGSCEGAAECGANGQNFVCGCEELTCATFGSGAECGTIQTRCAGSPSEIDCGECFGQQVCENNACVCPAGVNCDQGCGSCASNEVCVDGQCCEPAFPCAQNECSPPGGLDDGCGGKAQCPPCGDEEECVLSEGFVFECLGDCTCEAQGVECGSTVVCGQPALCGTCQDNGYEAGYSCNAGRCVCQDSYEDNDVLSRAAVVCGGASGDNCFQEAWAVQLDATVHGIDDDDHYALQILDAETVLVTELYAGLGAYEVWMSYVCPNGEPGLAGCAGPTTTIGGLKFCGSESRALEIFRYCEASETAEVGTLFVVVRPQAIGGDCEPYSLGIFATYDLPGLN
ncbi:MAG: hypothetical protein AAF436_04725 [Myxococcota bacterium]